MTIAQRRGDTPCLQPVSLQNVVDDPEAIRDLARVSGPYRFPDRPGGFIWPTWHTRWAFAGTPTLAAAEPLLNHSGFIAAAAEMCGSDDVVPEGVYVNLGTPWMAQPVMHTDLPLFRGIDQDTVPGWFLQAMGASRLFEVERINSITAVAWFFAGEHGGFTCWPDGPSGRPQRQTAVWNTAIVGDNDFMYHLVDRIGPDGVTSPHGMTAETVLDHDGAAWTVVDDGDELARFDDHEVRLSISWKATVHDGSDATTSVADAYGRLDSGIEGGLVAIGLDDLFDEPSRQQIMDRWPGFLPIGLETQ